MSPFSKFSDKTLCTAVVLSETRWAVKPLSGVKSIKSLSFLELSSVVCSLLVSVSLQDIKADPHIPSHVTDGARV